MNYLCFLGVFLLCTLGWLGGWSELCCVWYLSGFLDLAMLFDLVVSFVLWFEFGFRRFVLILLVHFGLL